MRGHLRKRGSAWYAVVYRGRHPETGKKQYNWIPLRGTKPEAERQLARILSSSDGSPYRGPVRLTVADLLSRWLTEYVDAELAPSTAQGYRDMSARYVLPVLGNVPLSKLTPDHLQRLYSRMRRRGLSATTVRHVHTMMHRALRSAVRWGMISRNVAAADSLELPRATGREIQPWQDYEIGQFLDRLASSPYHALFYTALFTGLRRSELLALRWSDLDLLGCQLSVSRSVHQLKDGGFVFRQNKTEKSRRVIALPPSCAMVLREYRDRNPLARPDDLVFQRRGEPLRPMTVSHAWRRLCKQAGVRPIRLHDARHTFASRMLARGVNLKVVQEMLGHSRMETTADIYTHVLLDLQRDAAARYDGLVASDGFAKDLQNHLLSSENP